jgi:hypothetical protein
LNNNKYQVFNNDSEIIDKIIKLYSLNNAKKENITYKNRKKIKEYSSENIYLNIKKVIYEN